MKNYVVQRPRRSVGTRKNLIYELYSLKRGQSHQ